MRSQLKSLFTSLLLLVFCLGIAGCKNAENKEDIANTKTETVSSTEEVTSKKMESATQNTTDGEEVSEQDIEVPSANAAESTIKNEDGIKEGQNTSSDSWKQLYIDYINQSYQSEWVYYQLMYINDDDIPELLIDYNITASGAEVCTVYNNELRSMQVYTYGVSYIERANLLRSAGGHMDSYYDIIYSIRNGEFVELEKGEYGIMGNAELQFDEDGTPIYNYYWNEAEVSQEEYQQDLSAVFDPLRATSPYDNSYDKAGIIDYINSF